MSPYDLRMARSAVFDAANTIDPEQQLTTGEAAKLLNSSRQHVVDLCESGLLPFTTLGTHRRVRRGDIEALRNRTERLTRDQQRSLWLAYAVAGRIVSDPARAFRIARHNLSTMQPVVRGSAANWLDEWHRLLDGPVERLLTEYTSRNLRGRELRQHSPFATVLTDHERANVLAQWRAMRSGREPDETAP